MDVRIIPCLQLTDQGLVKTTKFSSPKYIGDPLNTVRIFNELEVDELCFLDIRATLQRKEPEYSLLAQIADECFMPLSYGGGISSIDVANRIFSCGFEKIILNSALFDDPLLVTRLADRYGSQAVIVAVDVKKTWTGNYTVMSHSGTKKTGKEPLAWAEELARLGAGELLLTSIGTEGTWSGFDTLLVKKIVEGVSIPVIAHGGAGKPEDIGNLLKHTGTSAVAVGSLFLYQKKDMGVLVNFPKEKILAAYLSS